MSAIFQDVVYALRRLAKSPGFTFLAVLTLALGIGLNSAVFSVVNAVLLRPLPVAAPDELANVYTAERSGLGSSAPMAFPDYVDLAEHNESFSRLAAYTSSGMVLEVGDRSEVVMGELVSGNYFDLLGVRAFAGRTFGEAEDRRGDPQAVAVLSHRAWQRRFGGDSGVIGDTVRINGRTFTILGVAVPGFFGMQRGFSPEVWLPIRISSQIHAGSISNWGEPTEGLDRLDDRARRWHFVVGRLRAGVSFRQAAAELETLGARLRQEYAATNEDRSFTLVPTNQVRLFPGVDQALHGASLVVMGVVALVLLIACANLANMLLARAGGRRKEIATRLALGAGRGALVRQLLTESLALAFVGGAAGLLLALLSNAAVERLQLPIPVDLALGLALDVRVVLFTFAAATTAAVVFGLAPALQATRADLSSALREEARGSSAGLGKRRLRSALVVTEVALSLVLLICAGLAVRSMQSAHHIDPGFDPEGLVVASLAPERQGYSETQAEELFRRLDERLSAQPGVRSVGFASNLPLTLNISVTGATTEDNADAPVQEWPVADTALVGPGYFETIGIPLLRGRGFNEWDLAGAPRVAVVNQTLAAQLWPAAEALGQRLRIEDDDEAYEVVGVVPDGKYRSLGEKARPYVYRALAQDFTGAQTLVARTDGDPGRTLATIRQLVRELDSNLALWELATIEEATSSALMLPRLGAALFGLFGAVGLILAMIGIYGVVSYLVSQRTHEIGIRMAMGARRRDVLALVLRDGVVLTAAGVVAGLLLAAGATRALSAMLFGISATDVVTFAAVSLFLSLVALLATVIPARRAANIDPLAALRYE